MNARAALGLTLIGLAIGVAPAQDRKAAQQEASAGEAVTETGVSAQAARAALWARIADGSRELRQEEERIAAEREARFIGELERAEQQAVAAQQRHDSAEARSNQLDRAWEANTKKTLELEELLRQHEGSLGELFGVTRQVAGDAATVLEQSQLSILYAAADDDEERSEFLRRVAAARTLPSIDELERLWFELQRELVDGGKVMRVTVPVTPRADALAEPALHEVVMIGPFVAVTGGEYLGYLTASKSLSLLEHSVPLRLRAIARSVQAAPDSGAHVKAVVDPARGALLGLHLGRPGLIDRIREGEVVAYAILTIGAIGLLVAAWQYFQLVVAGRGVRAQLAAPDQPSALNPLGRVLLATRQRVDTRTHAQVAQLVVSDAILRELPGLERFQSFLRLVIAAGPLLGLVGTVIGMIITFKAITAAGSSDPTLMARGIGQAMIATVLGLGVAIPLLFINTALTARSRRIAQTLDEEGFRLLARLGYERER